MSSKISDLMGLVPLTEDGIHQGLQARPDGKGQTGEDERREATLSTAQTAAKPLKNAAHLFSLADALRAT